MGIFQKLSKVSGSTLVAEDRFPDYVDSLVSEDGVSPSLTHERIAYGIDETINLIRRLPDGDNDMVISIVRETLESTNIDVAVIISDANQKAASLQSTISTLGNEIEQLELSIADKKALISDSEINLEETHRVKQLLEVSEKKSKNSPSKENMSALPIEDLSAEDDLSEFDALEIGSGS